MKLALVVLVASIVALHLCVAVPVKDTTKKETKDVGKLDAATKKDNTVEKLNSVPAKEKGKKDVNKVSGNEFKFAAGTIKSGKKADKGAKNSKPKKKVPKLLKTVSGQLHPKSSRSTEEKLMSMLKEDKSAKPSLSKFGDDKGFAEKHQRWLKDEGTAHQLLDAFQPDNQNNKFTSEKNQRDSQEPATHQEKEHSGQGHFVVYNKPSAKHHRVPSRYDNVESEADEIGTARRYSLHSPILRPARKDDSEEWAKTSENRQSSPWTKHSTGRYSSRRKQPESARRYHRENHYKPRREADQEEEYQESEEPRYYYRRPKEEKYSFSDDSSEEEEFYRMYSNTPRGLIPGEYLSQMGYARRMIGGY